MKAVRSSWLSLENAQRNLKATNKIVFEMSNILKRKGFTQVSCTGSQGRLELYRGKTRTRRRPTTTGAKQISFLLRPCCCWSSCCLVLKKERTSFNLLHAVGGVLIVWGGGGVGVRGRTEFWLGSIQEHHVNVLININPSISSDLRRPGLSESRSPHDLFLFLFFLLVFLLVFLFLVLGSCYFLLFLVILLVLLVTLVLVFGGGGDGVVVPF